MKVSYLCVLSILLLATCITGVSAHTDPAGWGSAWQNWGNPSVSDGVIDNYTVGATSRYPGELDVFWYDRAGIGDVSDGTGLMTRWTTGTDWYNTQRTSRTYRPPAAVSWDANRIDVFTQAYRSAGSSEHDLQWTHWDPADGWTNWFTLPNNTVIHLHWDYSPAAISPSPGYLTVFFVDPSGHLRHLDYSDYGDGWTHTVEQGQLLGGDLTSSPAAAVYTVGSGLTWRQYTEVFARGLNNNLWKLEGTRSTIFSDIVWGSWTEVPSGSGLAGAPSVVSRYPGSLDVVYKRTNGDTVMRSYSHGTWSGEVVVYGVGDMTSDPTLVSWSQYHMQIFEVGTSKIDDNLVWAYPWNSPNPVLSTMRPDGPANQQFTLSLGGANFYPNSVILIDGNPVADTNFVTEHSLTVTLTLAQGDHTVTVKNPSDGVGADKYSATWHLEVIPASTIGVFRPSTHLFYLDYNGNGVWNGAAVDRSYNFGISGDIPISGDWNSDGTTEIGVFRPSTHLFYLDYNGNGAWNGASIDKQYNFGITGDTPISGDWNADGRTEIGVYRPSTHMFYLDYSGDGAWNGASIDKQYNFGITGDIPITGDWNLDGKYEIGVFRNSTHLFYLDYNGNGAWNGASVDRQYNFGITGDIPISGDWNNDVIPEIGVFRNSTHLFYLDYNGNGAWNGAGVDRTYNFGITGDTPISGKW